MKKVTIVVMLIGITMMSYAQETSKSNGLPTKNTNIYLGLQANQLIKELFNLSGSGTAANNPYLISLGINKASSGWGANIGIGITVNQFENDDDTDFRKTISNAFNFRVGLEKKWTIGNRLGASVGMDALFVKRKSETESEFSGNGFTSSTKTTTNSIGWGIGPRVALNFSITDRIILGTESTYYFRSTKSDNTFKQEDNNGFNEESESTFTSQSFNLNSPVVLFLIYKF